MTISGMNVYKKPVLQYKCTQETDYYVYSGGGHLMVVDITVDILHQSHKPVYKMENRFYSTSVQNIQLIVH